MKKNTQSKNTSSIYSDALMLTVPTVLFFMIYSVISFVLNFDPPSPSQITDATLRSIIYAIEEFSKDNGRLPSSLEELPDAPNGSPYTLQDGWGNKINYRVQKNGVIELLSLGADGLQGGIEESSDISQSFQTRNSFGELLRPPFKRLDTRQFD